MVFYPISNIEHVSGNLEFTNHKFITREYINPQTPFQKYEVNTLTLYFEAQRRDDDHAQALLHACSVHFFRYLIGCNLPIHSRSTDGFDSLKILAKIYGSGDHGCSSYAIEPLYLTSAGEAASMSSGYFVGIGQITGMAGYGDALCKYASYFEKL